MASAVVEKPLDMIRLSIDERVFIKCRGGRQIRGRLHAFDEHLNMVLSSVEETSQRREQDPDTLETIVHEEKRTMEMLFVRGDVVVLVSPPLRTA